MISLDLIPLFSHNIAMCILRMQPDQHQKMIEYIKNSKDICTATDLAPVLTSFYDNRTLHKTEEFVQIASTLHEHAKEYARQLNFNFEQHDISMQNMWFQIYEQGMGHSRHNHDTSIISCAYYLSAPENCADITFWNPLHNALLAYPRTQTTHNHFLWTVQPQEGTLLMFPGYIDHGTGLNETIEPRIILSANWIWHKKH